MKAAILKEFGMPLSIEHIELPDLGTGEVLVEVVAAPVLHYLDEVFSGERKYALNLPVVPGAGAVGRVLETGPDSTKLKVGDWVFCDPTVRSRDDVFMPDITLQGLSARGAGGLHLQQYFHNGSFAKKMITPTENVIKIGDIEMEDAGKWCLLVVMAVPYGGFLAANLQAGETVAISGATGTFGSAAVAVALAMGAGSVIALGRNETILQKLSTQYGSRVKTVKLIGDTKADQERIYKTANSPIDLVLDILPPPVSTSVVKTAIITVRPGGKIVLMGGVGMLGGEDLKLSYPWIMRNNITIIGQWSCNREAPYRMIQLIKSGLLSLDDYNITTFTLDKVNEAVEYAAANYGAFKATILKM